MELEVYDSKIGTIMLDRKGLYAEIDNDWDKSFSDENQLNAWLKKHNADPVGYDKR